MHILRDPSFCLTNKIWAPYKEILGRMKSLSSKSLSWSFNSFNWERAILHGGNEMGFISCNKSMPNSISLFVGIRGMPLRKTFGNSVTIRTYLIKWISHCRSLNLTKWYKQPLDIILQAFKQEIIWPFVIEFPPSTLE